MVVGRDSCHTHTAGRHLRGTARHEPRTTYVVRLLLGLTDPESRVMRDRWQREG